MKNIPLPPWAAYRKALIEKECAEEDAAKAFFFLKGESEDQDRPEKFGFASSKTPPSLPELSNFEDDLLNLVVDKLAHDRTGSAQLASLSCRISLPVLVLSAFLVNKCQGY